MKIAECKMQNFGEKLIHFSERALLGGHEWQIPLPQS
jgi:hypothetical protein